MQVVAEVSVPNARPKRFSRSFTVTARPRRRAPGTPGNAVASGTYTGSTAQGFPFELRVSGDLISHLTFKVQTDCGLTISGSLAQHIRIGANGAFYQETSNTILDGAFRGNRASGSIRAGFHNPESGRFCDGKSTFSAHLASG